MSLLAALSSRPPDPNAIFRDCIWLGAKHDGYPVSSLKDYDKIRRPVADQAAPDSPMLRSPSEEAALLQSLFTFGLLEAVLETSVPESLLIRRTAVGAVMHSDYLPRFLDETAGRIAELRSEDPGALQDWFHRTHMTLQQMHGLLHLELRHKARSTFKVAGLSDSIVADIIYVGASLAEELNHWRRRFLLPTSMGFNWSFVMMLDERYKNEMIQNGWCRFTVQTMLDSSLRVMQFASAKKFDISGEQSHAKCTTDNCVRNCIDTTNYKAKHATLGCSCSCQKPSLEKIISALDAGEIPVISVNTSGSVDAQNHPGELEILHASDMPYIAISHVWVDGLGSTSEMGLPLCQVKRLSLLTAKLDSQASFWIDALCVPESKLQRKKAIGLMGKTYKNAKAVIVIDGGINSCSASAALQEKLFRVVTSGWMQRLWTLQEALLAQNLVFAFSDGLIPLSDLIPDKDNLLNCVTVGLSAEIFRLSKRQYSMNLIEMLSIGDVARSLRSRTTSKVEDETLAIASLLNVDSYELFGLPPNMRMITFLLRVKMLPSNIIFLSGKKIMHPRFRWAPTTLMIRKGNEMATSNQDATCTAEGLVAAYSCIYFDKNTFTEGDLFCCLHDKSEKYLYSLYDPEEGTEKQGSVRRMYTCNAILLNTPLPLQYQNVYTAVAIFIEDNNMKRQSEDGKWTPICAYRRRLLVSKTTDEKLSNIKSKIITIKGSGKLNACIT